MKGILLLVLGTLYALACHADCAGGGLYVFPKGRKVKQNSIFIIEGYSSSQDIIHLLGSKHQAYLKSGDSQIKLLVMEVCEGGYDLTQALLKPETMLQAGQVYTLYIDSLQGGNGLRRYNLETRDFEPITYQVLEEQDTLRPLVSSRPKEIDKSIDHYGCGPAVYVNFSNPATDDSELLVKTIVKNLTTHKETTYYLQPKENKIKIGHDMCSGEFYLESGTLFEVEFSFMDASGNITPWSGNRIRFTKPVEKSLLED